MTHGRRTALIAVASCALTAILAGSGQAAGDQFSYKTKTFSSGAGLITFKSVKCGDHPLVGGGLAPETDDLWLTASNLTTKLRFVDLPSNSWLGVYTNTDQVNSRDMFVTAICEKRGGDRFVYRTDDVQGPPLSDKTLKVSCKGDPLVGGGVYPVDPDAQLANRSMPTASGNGWIGGAYNFANDSHRLEVTAICEKDGDDRFRTTESTTLVAASSFDSTTASCGNDRLVGGGFAAEDPEDFRLNQSAPTPQHDGWEVTGTNFDMALQNAMTAFAMCERR